MAGSINKVILIGNLGADPEVRATQDGKEIANLRIATSESWKDRNGERKEKTEWHRVVVYNDGLVKVIKNYLRKGSKVYIEGQLQTRKWQDKEGRDQYTTEICLQNYNGTLTMLDGKSGGGESSNDSYGGGYNQSAPRAASSGGNNNGGYAPAPELDDEIPF